MSAKINIRHTDGVTILDVNGRITLGDGALACVTPFRKRLRATPGSSYST